MKFVRGDQLDRQAIAEAVNTQRLQGAKVIDPCLIGQVRNIPASVYAKLAEKHPEKFQPLENGNQNVALPEKAATGAALGIAPQYRYVGIFETFTPETGFFPAAFTNDSRVYGTFIEFLDEAPFVSFSAAVIEHEP